MAAENKHLKSFNDAAELLVSLGATPDEAQDLLLQAFEQGDVPYRVENAHNTSAGMVHYYNIADEFRVVEHSSIAHNH